MASGSAGIPARRPRRGSGRGPARAPPWRPAAPPTSSASRPASSAASRASGSRWAARQCAAATTGTSSNAAGKGGAVPRPLRREEVRDHRARDQLVADPEPLVGLREDEAVLERLRETGREVGVEAVRRRDAGRSWTAAPRAARVAAASSASNAVAAREAVAVHRALRRGEQPEHAAALRASDGRAARRSVPERPGELAWRSSRPRCDELLDDQRRARRSLSDEDDDRRGRALALDPLDQRGDLAPREGRQVHPDRCAQPGLDDREVLAQRMLARQPVGLVGEHEGRSARRGAIRATKVANAAGRGVGDVEVLEREDDGPLRATPAEPAEQRLQRPRLAALGIRELAPARAPGGRRRARPGRGSPTSIGRASRRRSASSSSSGRVGEQRGHGLEHGGPGRVHRAVGAAPEDQRRLGDAPIRSSASSRNRVAPMPGAAGDEDGRRRAAGRGRRRRPRRPARAPARAR